MKNEILGQWMRHIIHFRIGRFPGPKSKVIYDILGQTWTSRRNHRLGIWVVGAWGTTRIRNTSGAYVVNSFCVASRA